MWLSHNRRFDAIDWASDYEDPLTIASTGGKYNIHYGEGKIRLRYIQNTVITKIELPSGEIIEESADMTPWDNLYAGRYDRLSRYHATYPAIYEYEFDQIKKNLKLRYLYPFPPRLKKIVFTFDKASGALNNQKYKLPAERATQIFGSLEEPAWIYADCKLEERSGWFD